MMDGQVVAGVVLFNSPSAWHAQYIAADEAGYRVSALDAVFAEVMVQRVGQRRDTSISASATRTRGGP